MLLYDGREPDSQYAFDKSSVQVRTLLWSFCGSLLRKFKILQYIICMSQCYSTESRDKYCSLNNKTSKLAYKWESLSFKLWDIVSNIKMMWKVEPKKARTLLAPQLKKIFLGFFAVHKSWCTQSYYPIYVYNTKKENVAQTYTRHLSPVQV